MKVRTGSGDPCQVHHRVGLGRGQDGLDVARNGQIDRPYRNPLREVVETMVRPSRTHQGVHRVATVNELADNVRSDEPRSTTDDHSHVAAEVRSSVTGASVALARPVSSEPAPRGLS